MSVMHDPMKIIDARPSTEALVPRGFNVPTIRRLKRVLIFSLYPISGWNFSVENVMFFNDLALAVHKAWINIGGVCGF